jgi:YD repeat-containing protein
MVLAGSTATAHWAAGRQADTVTALTSRTAFDRLGRPTDAWSADLVRTKATYDRLGNQVETIANYRDGVTTGGTASDDVRSAFAYDVLGELTGYCPAVQVASVGSCAPGTTTEPKAWHYAFDAMGRQTKTIPPDNSAITDLTTEETVYEPGGRVAKTCRYIAGAGCASTNSRHVDFTYDDLGRVLTQKTWDRAAGSDTLKFTKTLTWKADGSPATVSEGASSFSYLYDAAGRRSQLKRGSTVLTAYTYTAETNRIATRTDGTQGEVAFSYDWAGRQTVINPPDSYVAGVVTRTYRLDGLLSTQSFPSSITETLGYDAAKRPISISLGVAGTISQAFDRAGNITADGRSLAGITGDAGGNTQSFSYDALHRLTGSTGLAASRSYQYDLDGNRTRRVEGTVTTDYLYDRADQLQSQTIGATTRTFDYDRYGNLTSSWDGTGSQTTYGYDEASRLTAINPPGGAPAAIGFTIDALDPRPPGRPAARRATRTAISLPPRPRT